MQSKVNSDLMHNDLKQDFKKNESLHLVRQLRPINDIDSVMYHPAMPHKIAAD